MAQAVFCLPAISAIEKLLAVGCYGYFSCNLIFSQTSTFSMGEGRP